MPMKNETNQFIIKLIKEQLADAEKNIKLIKHNLKQLEPKKRIEWIESKDGKVKIK